MITQTSRGILQIVLLWNCLLSLVSSEWLTLGDYDYNNNGGGYYGHGARSPPVYQRSYDDYNNYRPSFESSGHNDNSDGYGGQGGYGNDHHSGSSNSGSGGYYNKQKGSGHPSHNKNEGYGYEKHDYKYEKEYYDHDGYKSYGHETAEHGGYHESKEGHHQDKGYASKKHEYGSKDSGYGGHDDHDGHDDHKTTSGYGGEKSAGHWDHGTGGYGKGQQSHAKPLYGYCYNDFDCPMSQCCLKQSGVNICSDLNANTGACSRRRECRHQQDCPSSQCCFPRDPNTLARRYAAGYTYRTFAQGYGNGGYGTGGYGNRHLHMDGVCQPAGMRGQPCMMLLQGVTARGCPCTTGLTCNIPSGSNVGTCQ